MIAADATRCAGLLAVTGRDLARPSDRLRTQTPKTAISGFDEVVLPPTRLFIQPLVDTRASTTTRFRRLGEVLELVSISLETPPGAAK